LTQDSIPLADDDPSAIIDEDDEVSNGQMEAGVDAIKPVFHRR
jgi:hypothetical protein